jgi:hypothetical protein
MVECEIESNHDQAGLSESAHFRVAVEPSAIDSIVAQLQALETEGTGTAQLTTMMGNLKENSPKSNTAHLG